MLSGTYLELQTKFEKLYRERLLETLAYIDGVIVAVSAQVDATSQVSNTTAVLPPGQGTVTAPRLETEHLTESRSGITSGEPGVRSNAGHYKLIYSVVFVSALVYTILSSPLLLLGMAATAGAWAYAFVLTSPDTALQVFGFELRRREKLIALVPFSVLMVTLTGMINSLLYVLCISSCISLPHASFHEVSELDALDALELQGLAAPDPLSVGKDFEVPS